MEIRFESKYENEKFYVEGGMSGVTLKMEDVFKELKKIIEGGGKVRRIRIRYWSSWDSIDKEFRRWLKGA